MNVTYANRPPPASDAEAVQSVRVLLVVEGRNDVEFLRRISQILHQHDECLPDLGQMEQDHTLVFVPIGGGGIGESANRLAPLQLSEFHLYDHELPPETEIRRAAIEQINRRDGCRGVLTRKRSLENYLHPQAIQDSGGACVEFSDFDSPPEILAQANYCQTCPSLPWEQLPYRARRRLTNRVKRWLNTQAVEYMTPELLAERDPDGEVASWLQAIQRLAGLADVTAL
ncbi:MAG: ATP-dependent endonuclease [Pirellulaceae bacterium]